MGESEWLSRKKLPQNDPNEWRKQKTFRKFTPERLLCIALISLWERGLRVYRVSECCGVWLICF
jgi:hypothetical protein